MLIKPPRGVTVNKSHFLASGLIGAFILNEMSGSTVRNYALPNYSGTFVNNVAWGVGGLVVTGTGYVSLPSGFGGLMQDSGTLFFITRPISAARGHVFDARLGGNDGWDAELDMTVPSFWLLIDTGDPITATADLTGLSTTKYHSFAGTYDGSNVRVYVDGILKDTQGQTGVASETNQPLIGNLVALSLPLTNVLVCIYFWDRALSSAEILYLHNFSFCFFSHSVRWWSLFLTSEAEVEPMTETSHRPTGRMRW